MKFEIEDFFGNSMVEIDFYAKPNGFWDELEPQLENKIHGSANWGVADYEDEYHIRIQYDNKDVSDEEFNSDLKWLVNTITELSL